MSDTAPPHQLSEAERSIIAKNIVKTEHTITEYKEISTATNGNLGGYFKIEMTIQEKNGNTQKHTLFMKMIPEDCWQSEYVTAEGLFTKEVNFYKQVSGCFREYLSTDFCPRCYLAVPGKIVMADAAIENYRLYKDTTLWPLDFEHVKVGLMALARLHAGSFIYEEKTGRKVGDDFPDVAREPVYNAGSLGVEFLKAGSEAIAAIAPYLETDLGRDPKTVAVLQENAVLWMKKLQFYLTEDSPHRRVICHGDSWPANFLFKYDDQEKPVSAMLIDFQLTRLRSPAVDVNMFLFISVPFDDLKKWRESLYDIYYQELTREMRNNGLDANSIYPKEDFLQAVIYYQIAGFIYNLLYFPFVLVPLDVKQEAESSREKAFDFYFKDRSQYLIKWYKEYPMLRRSINEATDEFYRNFIETKRGLTELIS